MVHRIKVPIGMRDCLVITASIAAGTPDIQKQTEAIHPMVK